jgi:hypothetical protein
MSWGDLSYGRIVQGGFVLEPAALWHPHESTGKAYQMWNKYHIFKYVLYDSYETVGMIVGF